MQLDDLWRRKLLLVTGKGGIGKSLMTGVLGMQAAAQGRRVCLLESSHQDQLAPLFGKPPVGHDLTEVRRNLFVINLDAQKNFRDYIIKHLKLPGLVDKVFSQPIVSSLIEMLPGIAEIMLLGRMYYFLELQADPFDLVIYDGFASGHFLSLMTTPDAILEADFAGPVTKETQRIRDFIGRDENAGIVVVTRPEGLVISETLEFLQKFEEQSPTAVAAVICNRYFELGEGSKPKTDNPAVEQVCQYLNERDAESRRGLQMLGEGMRQLRQKPRLFRLPERGLWEEPLDENAVATWLREGKEIVL